jgi:hypothetical protein
MNVNFEPLFVSIRVHSWFEILCRRLARVGSFSVDSRFALRRPELFSRGKPSPI